MPAGAGPSEPERSIDRSLMARIRDGDAEALERLVQQYWSPLVHFASGFTGCQDEAEDLVQDTFVRVWKARSSWTPTGTVRAYLFTILRNLCLHREEWRRVRVDHRERERLRPRRSPSPHAHLEAREVLKSLNRALKALPPRRQEVFRLVCLQGLSYQEAAQVMGVAVPTVANQMSSALAALREAVATSSQPVS